MLKRSLALVAGFVLCGVVAQAQTDSQQLPQTPEVNAEQQPEHRLQDQNDAQTDKGVTTNAPPSGRSVVSVPAQAKTGDEAQHGSEEGTEFWPPILGYRLKVTDTLIALFTAGLFVATFFLWLATRNLVRGADNTAQYQLRAYVSATVNHIYPFNPTTLVCLRYRIANHGQTPAYGMTVSALVDLFPYPPPENWMPPELPVPTYESKATLFADAPKSSLVWAKRLFDANETAEIIAGTGRRIYVWGIVKYLDIFKRPQTTRFCYCVAGQLAQVAAGHPEPAVSFQNTPQHNEAT